MRGNDVDSNSKKPGERFMWTGVGVALGAGLGLCIGILFFDAFPVFMAVGAGVGVALGAAFDLLKDCLVKRWSAIDGFRPRNITGLAHEDHAVVRQLFDDLLLALANSKGRSPVAVAKAMHLLAPGFFPIWDAAIAKAYGCGYNRNPSDAYLKFCEKSEKIVRSLAATEPNPTKTLLKRIDEYNYARFSKGWIN